MVGTINRDEPPVIETDETLSDYTRSLLLPNDKGSAFRPVAEAGPIAAYELCGYTGLPAAVLDTAGAVPNPPQPSGHIVTVNTHPFCDHDAEEARVFADLEARGFVCFAAVLNPDDEECFEIRHWQHHTQVA